MTLSTTVSLLSSAGAIIAAFIAHFLTKRREATKSSAPELDRKSYSRISDYVAGLRDKRPSYDELEHLYDLFPGTRQLEQRITRWAAYRNIMVVLLIVSVAISLLAAFVRRGPVTEMGVCPGLVNRAIQQTGEILDGPTEVVGHYSSPDKQIYLCRTEPGNLFYYGITYEENQTAGIVLPATAFGSLFRAENRNGDAVTIYEVDSKELTLTIIDNEGRIEERIQKSS